MKKQSYDVPAYKFGIVKLNNSIKGNSYSPFEYISAMSLGNCNIIPFENVDGLTISELQNLWGPEEVFLVCYLHYEQNGYNNSKINYFRIITQWFISTEKIKENLTTPIDQVVEKMLENNYDEFDLTAKKACNCFFERYQDKSYELTKTRIKRLEKNE